MRQDSLGLRESLSHTAECDEAVDGITAQLEGEGVRVVEGIPKERWMSEGGWVMGLNVLHVHYVSACVGGGKFEEDFSARLANVSPM